jgi:hypothetical protein
LATECILLLIERYGPAELFIAEEFNLGVAENRHCFSGVENHVRDAYYTLNIQVWRTSWHDTRGGFRSRLI